MTYYFLSIVQYPMKNRCIYYALGDAAKWPQGSVAAAPSRMKHGVSIGFGHCTIEIKQTKSRIISIGQWRYYEAVNYLFLFHQADMCQCLPNTKNRYVSIDTHHRHMAWGKEILAIWRTRFWLDLGSDWITWSWHSALCVQQLSNTCMTKKAALRAQWQTTRSYLSS